MFCQSNRTFTGINSNLKVLKDVKCFRSSTTFVHYKIVDYD